MAKIELEYIEIDGLLFPNIEVDNKKLLSNLGKYGRLWLEYLCNEKPQMYRELLFTGKLAQHCTDVDQVAFSMSEDIRAQYLLNHPMPDEDTLARIQISKQAQMIADEIVAAELIYK